MEMQFYWKVKKEVTENEESFFILCKAPASFKINFQSELLHTRSRTLFKIYRQRELKWIELKRESKRELKSLID